MARVTVQEIRAFGIEELWDLPDGLTEETSLTHDIGIAGLDGKAFMEEYSARFGVALEGFEWVVFFGPEGLGIGAPVGVVTYLWRRFIRRMPSRELLDLPELTLGHLVICAHHGRWFIPTQAA
jgi:hypothetical protein